MNEFKKCQVILTQSLIFIYLKKIIIINNKRLNIACMNLNKLYSIQHLASRLCVSKGQ